MRHFSSPLNLLLIVAISLGLMACGSSSNDNRQTPSFTIGGTVTGLLGSGLVLQNNGGDDLTIFANGPLSFQTSLLPGSNYTITVKTQPASPTQRCSIANNGGTIQSGDISSIRVHCISTCSDDDVGIIDACGLQISAVDLHDPVTMTMTGLTPNIRHTIIITDPLSAEITPNGGLIATSDDDGSIDKIVIVQNMPATGELGTYTVTVARESDGMTEQTLNYSVENRSRVQCVDNLGNPQASFLAGELVYAKIDKNDGSLTDGNYDVYVLPDLAKTLIDGGLIGGTPYNVTVTAGSGSVSLGAFSSGAKDVLVDVNRDGFFNQNTDLFSRHNRLLPCFIVQSPSIFGILQIASDKNGNKREIFDPTSNINSIRDIQSHQSPIFRSAIAQPNTIDTYLVLHQTIWADGDTLNDVTGGAKTSPSQNDTASLAPWALASLNTLASLAGTTCYDIVIDTNKSGTFDIGTDFVDNIDHLGNNTCGVRISTASCSNVNIISHVDGSILEDTVITLVSTITGAPTEAYLIITSGEQSNTIALALSGNNFSSNIPLFAGDNHITVSGIYADNSSCSQTITITSQAPLALFRAQLTWGGSTDMDLHVVRPGGAYSNGGRGADDCNYANCKAAFDGSGSNSISWGTGGEEDDPKLDVDCRACGNGIENIWMNQITEDGQYKIYVDAFDGLEFGNVIVNISILGTTVGQVNCGSMAANTATDSCFIGTIDWTGGTSGTGDFTPAGTTALNF